MAGQVLRGGGVRWVQTSFCSHATGHLRAPVLAELCQTQAQFTIVSLEIIFYFCLYKAQENIKKYYVYYGSKGGIVQWPL